MTGQLLLGPIDKLATSRAHSYPHYYNTTTSITFVGKVFFTGGLGMGGPEEGFGFDL